MVITIFKRLLLGAGPLARLLYSRLIKFIDKNRAVSWIIFLGIFLFITLHFLQDKYLVTIPKQGGSITEAIVGNPRFINPVLAFTQVDKDLVAIVYSGLFSVDQDGQAIPELASEVSMASSGLEYIVTIREDAKFHDGKLVTAEDVVFTIEKIQDPLVKSPLQPNWYGVTAELISENQVKFILEKPYNNFLNLLDVGILPKHIWEDILVEEFPFSTRNINPLGSGPYMISEVKRTDSERITGMTLKPFRDGIYNPYIDSLAFTFAKTEDDQIALYDSTLVSTIAGIPADKVDVLNTKQSQQYEYNLPRVFGLFFNQKNNPALEYKEVREVIDQAIDRDRIVNEAFFGMANSNQSPLPITSGLFKETNAEKLSTEALKAKLSNAGWKFSDSEAMWKKTTTSGEVALELILWTPDTTDIAQVASMVRADLLKVGIPVTIKTDEIQRFTVEVIRKRQFEVVLFGYVTGIPTDLFSFWHSSGKIDPGLNITDYGNITVDKDLEAIKRASDQKEVEESYLSLQSEIQSDRPAVFLFSPKFIYLTPEKLVIPNKPASLGKQEDRFSNVESWYMQTEKVLPLFAK